ncbi:MAG: hypothetical protein U0Q22_17085 [Acidimicrobiales bacterium]
MPARCADAAETEATVTTPERGSDDALARIAHRSARDRGARGRRSAMPASFDTTARGPRNPRAGWATTRPSVKPGFV